MIIMINRFIWVLKSKDKNLISEIKLNNKKIIKIK